MAKTKAPKVVTKKHLARLERERRQKRAVVIGTVTILFAILGLILYGVLDQTVLRAHKMVISVNGEIVRGRDFQLWVRLLRQQEIDRYLQYYAMAQYFGLGADDSYLLSQEQQVRAILDDPQSLGQTAIDQMIELQLVRQYAVQNGIVMTEEEVEKAIQEDFQYYPNGTPTPIPTPTPVVFATLSPTQYALVSPTPTFTPWPTPSETPTPAFTPTVTPTIPPDATATFTPTLTPTATPYTWEAYQENYQKALQKYASLGMKERDFREIFYRYRLLRQKVYDQVTQDVSPEQEMVWARHILVDKKSMASLVRNLLAVGRDFGELAARYSMDEGTKEVGGDLGWFPRGKMVLPFEEAAFSLAIGEISQPIESAFGWHIIQVLGHEIRPLTAEEYQQARDERYQQWLAEQRSQVQIVIYDNWPELVPTNPTLDDALNRFYAVQQTAQAGGQ